MRTRITLTSISLKFVNCKTLHATKRDVLKVLAKFYNPVGVLQPILINLQIFFQQICAGNFNWDDEISIDLKADWEETMNALETMSKIAVPRKISHQNPDDHLEQIELHDFGDAGFTKLWDMYLHSIYL